jgi:hypothetical protein
MTVQPYDDQVVDYFYQIDDILKDSKHSMIALGRKAMDVQNLEFQSNIKIYPTVTELLKVL